MRGRRGWDQLDTFLMILSLVVEIAGNLLRLRWVYYIGAGIFLICIFRVFSRNLVRRDMENRKYMMTKYRILHWRSIRREKKRGTYTYSNEERERNGSYGGTVYAYYYCPTCGQQVRIPSGKGRVRVTCPRCGEKFFANS